MRILGQGNRRVREIGRAANSLAYTIKRRGDRSPRLAGTPIRPGLGTAALFTPEFGRPRDLALTCSLGNAQLQGTSAGPRRGYAAARWRDADRGVIFIPSARKWRGGTTPPPLFSSIQSIKSIKGHVGPRWGGT